MNSRAVEIAVGFFVLVGLSAAMFMALQVSGLAELKGGKGYELYAHFENIGGLKERSTVSVSGVKIGSVKSIDYDPELFNAKVTMLIGEQYTDFPIDTAAAINTSGLLGEQYIALLPGGDVDTLAPGDEVELTQSALVLENLIGQFLTSMGSSSDKEE